MVVGVEDNIFASSTSNQYARQTYNPRITLEATLRVTKPWSKTPQKRMSRKRASRIHATILLQPHGAETIETEEERGSGERGAHYAR